MREVSRTPGGIALKILKSGKRLLLFWILIFLIVFLTIREASSESVQFIMTSEKKPETLFLFPGRVSLLNLPCPITKAIVGSPNDIKAEVDTLSPKDAHVLLKKWRSEPSNLILKCSEKVFVFNLTPSRKSHYDYVKILSHIKSYKPLKVKSLPPNTPSKTLEGLRNRAGFTIRKVLDSSWGLEE